MSEYIKWTEEEWQAVAKRAKALKDGNPEMSWMQIALVSQDEIKPERRRFSFNKLVSLKPVFDILDLDADGNVKPPPPPPEPPKPEPVAAPAVPADPASPAALLAKGPPVNAETIAKWQGAAHTLPVFILIEEVFSRAEGMKKTAQSILDARMEVDKAIDANNQVLKGYVDRVDQVEKMVMDCMEGMDKVVERSNHVDEESKIVTIKHKEIMATLNLLLDKLGLLSKDAATRLGEEMVMPLNASNDRVRQQVTNIQHATDRRQPLNRMAAIRFLLIGLHTKDIQHIKERLPRSLNVELICHDNSERSPLPTNVHYCLVTGHVEYLGRWQRALALYGSRALRMENGSVSTFAKRVETLALTHHDGSGTAVKSHAA